jgi:CRISPR/Cas system-associated exonuclease Cas4 (RecB family)
LYALALEKLRPTARVVGGRLYACTSRGEFASHEVALDERGRARIADVARVLTGTIEAGFFPAAPRAGACERCDYQSVCGPREEERASIKRPIAWLEHLRKLS